MIKKHRLEELRSALEHIIEKAKEDGVITEDEKRLIETTEKNLKDYEKLVNLALEDGVITQDERNKLIDLEEKILADAYDTAKEDNALTLDEANLIKILITSFDKNASVSWLDEEIVDKEEA